MYNFFKYQQSARKTEAQRRSEDKYSQWLLKNQDKKQEAKLKEKQKIQQWIKYQLQFSKPQHIQDDHFHQWRHLRQFRDVESQAKFLGYKTFRHKPSNEMNKYFTQRERKQFAELSQKKQALVDNNKIEDCQRNRSLRSQGPLNPKIQFRLRKSDHEYLNPKMKFKHRTDKQRLNESKMQLDEKLKSVYSSFQLKRSTIGVPKVSSIPLQDIKDSRSRSSYSRYDVDSQNTFRYKNSVPSSNHEGLFNGFGKDKIYFELNDQDNVGQNLAESKNIQSSKVMTAKMPEIEIKNNGGKNFWKLAKTMEVQGDKDIKDFLLKTQYDRKKDLSNIKMNMTCSNFKKRPIL